MGEKEQGAARESNAPRDRNSGQSSGRSIPENSIEAGDVDGDGTLDEGPLSVIKQKTKSNQSNDRLGREDDPAAVDDDGDGTLDEGPLSVLKQKTKSNQSNDRLGREDDPDGSEAAKTGPIRIDSTPARGASDASAGGGKDG